MFRLEKLEISGFKSFADRTSLVFGEGITGVVGPNGCGKSNIAEAISWVLGEQSAKNLRGGKMEDVIFNGTRDRKPTGMAEVLLTLVAIDDIASGDSEDDDNEYEDALTNAEHAAEAARSLVQDLEPPAVSEGAEPAATSDGPDQARSAAPSVQADIAGDQGAQTEPLSEANPVKQESTPGLDSAPSDDVADETTVSVDSAESTTDLSASVNSDQSAERLEVPAHTGAEAQIEREAPKTSDRKRTRRPRKRRTIAISAGERVTVGRRLYRTGDSDYLMNGRPCLLRDIQDLFAGTGLGGAHYAIIEQGRIGQILSSKPLDRRGLIEEAAGITKFKSRKRATELKLESAKQNLTRLNDIISEVERQVNSLKRQAQKARRYRRLREEMRSLLKVIFTADYYRLNEAIGRVAGELEEAGRNRTEMDARLSELESENRAASAHARSAEDHLAELRERAASVELEADRARNRRNFEEQQINELAARIEELDRDQQLLDERLTLLDSEAQRRTATLQTLEGEVAGEQADLLARETLYHEELSALRNAESDIEQMRQRVLTEIGVTERLRNLGTNLEDALRRLELKQVSLAGELERASERRGEASSEFDRVRAEVEGDSALLSELNSGIAQRASHFEALRNQAHVLRTQLEGVHARREAATHRLTSLEDLSAHHAYYSDAVQHVLSREQAARINALGTLADFVEVEPQYEPLIESLFARELQSVLVPTIDDALAGVEYIKNEGLGRGAFLVVGLHGGEGDPEAERGGDDNGQTGASGDGEALGDSTIETWLVATEAELEALRAYPEFVPEERQLPPADLSSIDAIVIDLNADIHPLILDSHVESAPESDDRAAARQFDEEAVAHASRFQLDVLRAIDLLGIRPEIKNVVERAFPEKCAAAVVPDIEAALHLSIENASLIYVTYDGEQVVNGRLIVTGAQAGQKGTSLLGLKREIKQLREEGATGADEEQRMAQEVAVAEERLHVVEAEALALDQQLREHEKSAAARTSHLEGLSRDLERAAQHVRVVEAEIGQSAAERAELEPRIAELAGQLTAAEASSQAVQRSLDEAGMRFVDMRAQVEELSQQVSAVRASVAAGAERLHASRAEARRTEAEAEELRSRLNRNRLELYDSHGRTDVLRTSLEECAGAALRLEADRASLGELINTGSEELGSARTRSDELEKLLGELRQAVARAHDRRSQIEVERAKIESEAEHLTKSCFSELAMSLEDVVTSVELTKSEVTLQTSEVRDQMSDQQLDGEQQTSDTASTSDLTSDLRPLTSDVDAARARHDELRVKIDEMGPVNMMALEELEEADKRFRFLTEQRRDILDSIKMTEEALSEIKRRSRERFRHAFFHINENFQRMFVELFGGGRGEMMLIDEDDVLESGIDLIAQPPGKRLQNVLLLSGGEKAMAAIALVLAIFEYRPSPFCILDEVDAPLDEVNVGRFAGKVIEMSSGTQFLVITHNKRTMEAARALYGVTMEEPGVSKLVSVKFE